MQQSKLDSLTGMRGIAALLVVIYHSLPAWPHYRVTAIIADLGFLAVPFFFCLSGFVMQWTWNQRPLTPFIFLVRRLARIYPVALLGLVLSVLAFRTFHAPFGGYIGARNSVSLSAILLQSWAFNVPEIRQSWDGVSWSLSCEFFFYLVSPVLLPLVNKLSLRTALIVLIALVPAYATFALSIEAHLGQNFPTFAPIARLPEYLCGALLARIVLHRSIRVNRWMPFAALLFGVALPLGIGLHFIPVELVKFDVMAVPGFLLLIYTSANADISSRHRAAVFSTKPLVALGIISFSLYMMHPIVLTAIGLVSMHFPWSQASPAIGEAWRLLTLVVALCVSTAVYGLIEDPLHAAIVDRAARQSRKSAAFWN